MKYRAVIFGAKSGVERAESIWLETPEEAAYAGKQGLDLYHGEKYIVEDEEGNQLLDF